LAQKQWLIYPHSPKEHLVGVYHGEDSNHFILYVDQKILKILFNQTEELSVSFIVEEILYQLKVTKVDGEYEYELKSLQDQLIKDYEARLTWKQKFKRWFT